MKVKYSGTPFHHFKCGIIMPGVIELDDEWAQRLIEAGIVEAHRQDDPAAKGRSGLRPDQVRAVREPPAQDETPTDVGAGSPRPGQGNPAPTGFGIALPEETTAGNVGTGFTPVREDDPISTEPRKRKRAK